jgi:predicted nucleotidyltransferase
MTGQEIIELLRAEKPILEREFGVISIGLFGSFVQGAQGSKSDIDLLVEMIKPDFDRYMELKFRLEDLLGCSVDLVLKETLKPRLKPVIEKEVSYA